MSLDAVAFHASRSPDRPAMFDTAGVCMSYDRMLCVLVNLTRQLEAGLPGLANRRLVAVACDDPCWHFLILIALESMAVACLSCAGLSKAVLEMALPQCDLMLASSPHDDFSRDQFQITDTFIRDAREGPGGALAIDRFREDQTAIVLAGAASSREAYCVPLHARAVAARVHYRIWQYGLNQDTHLTVPAPLSFQVTDMQFVARAVLRCGGVLDFTPVGPPHFRPSRTTHAILVPLQLRAMLGGVAQDWRPERQLKLFVFGSDLPKTLRDLARQRLNAEIVSVYGSAVAGACAWIDDNQNATLLPGVEVKVLDVVGQSVVDGNSGAIWLRSQEMAGNPTDQVFAGEDFKEGWCNGGDRGIVLAPGTLQLLGQADTTINPIGDPLAVESIEDGLALTGIAYDLAVAHRHQRVVIVVQGARVPDAIIVGRIGEAFNGKNSNIAVIHVESLPRADDGQLERTELGRMIDARIGAHD